MSDDISDGMLTAYLDGELDAANAARIEAALATDATLAARLAALDVPMDALRQGFDAVLAQAPALPAVTAPRQAANSNIRQWAAAAMLAVGIGLGALWSPLGAPDPLADWKMAVANYQVLYVAETLDIGDPMPEETIERLAELSDALGRDLSAASAVDGLELRRAQMLGLGDEPLIQIAYLGDGNVPFAICVTRVGGTDYAPRNETLAGLASAHWVRDGFGYLVIGGDDLGLVEKIAGQLHGRI